MTSTSTYVVIFCLYCIVTFCIGIWAKKGTDTMEDYFVAKRDLGILPTAMAFYSTSQSSSAFLGMVGWAYTFGWASNNYISVSIAIGALFTWGLLSWKVRDLASKINGLTIPDLLHWRFPMKGVRLVALLIIIIAYIPMMTAQVKGCGILVQSVFGTIDFKWAALLGTCIVAIYVMLGGMKAIAYTDVVQGILMIISVVVLAIASLLAVGGFTQMNLQVAAIDPGYVSMSGVGGQWGFMYALSFILLFLISPLGQPITITKFFAMKDMNVTRISMPLSYTCVLIASFCFPIIGLCAKVLYPNLPNADTAFTAMATSVLPPIVGAIVLVALFAAVMSTIDAMLLTITSAFVRDLVQQIMGKSLNEKTLHRASMICTVCVAFIGWILAINTPGAIMTISALSTGLLGACFVVVMIGGVYSRKLTSQGALASMIAGFLGTILSFPGIVVTKNILGMHSFVWGLLASIIAGVVVTKMTKSIDIPELTLADLEVE